MLIQFINECFNGLISESLFVDNKLILISFVAFLTLSIGSYLNVVIFRTPILHEIQTAQVLKEEFDVERRLSDKAKMVLGSSNRSVCLDCGEQLGVRDNIPLLSYLFNLGKCRHCGAKISAQYPLIEALMLGLGTFLFVELFDSVLSLAYFACLVWVASGIVIAIVDFKEKTINDCHNFVHLISFACFISLSFGDKDVLSVYTDSGLVTCLFMLAATIIAKLKNEPQGVGEGDLPIIFQSSCIVFLFNESSTAALNEGAMLCILMFGFFVLTAIFKSFIDGFFDRHIPMAPALVATNAYSLYTHFI